MDWVRYVLGEAAPVAAAVASDGLLMLGRLRHIDSKLVKILLQLVLLNVRCDILALTARKPLDLFVILVV